jgi:hypothetical protein
MAPSEPIDETTGLEDSGFANANPPAPQQIETGSWFDPNAALLPDAVEGLEPTGHSADGFPPAGPRYGETSNLSGPGPVLVPPISVGQSLPGNDASGRNSSTLARLRRGTYAQANVPTVRLNRSDSPLGSVPLDPMVLEPTTQQFFGQVQGAPLNHAVDQGAHNAAGPALSQGGSGAPSSLPERAISNGTGMQEPVADGLSSLPDAEILRGLAERLQAALRGGGPGG